MNDPMKSENAGAGAQESKAEKFKRLAEPRVTNAVKKISLVGNLAGSGYEFTDEQSEKIFALLRSTVDEVEQKFQKSLNRRGYNDHGKFKL